MMRLVLKAAARVIESQIKKIRRMEAEEKARIESAYARGVKEARSRYAQAWMQGSGKEINEVQFTTQFVRELGVLSKRYHDEGFLTDIPEELYPDWCTKCGDSSTVKVVGVVVSRTSDRVTRYLFECAQGHEWFGEEIWQNPKWTGGDDGR